MSHLLPFFTIYNTYFFFFYLLLLFLYSTILTLLFVFIYFFFSLPYIRYLSYFHSPSHCAPDIGLEFNRFV